MLRNKNKPLSYYSRPNKIRTLVTAPERTNHIYTKSEIHFADRYYSYTQL